MKKVLIYIFLILVLSLIMSSCEKETLVKIDYDRKFIQLMGEEINVEKSFVKDKYYNFYVYRYFVEMPVIKELKKVQVLKDNDIIQEYKINEDKTFISIKVDFNMKIVTIYEDKTNSNGIVFSDDIYKNLAYTITMSNLYNNLSSEINVGKRKALLNIPKKTTIIIEFSNIDGKDYPDYSIIYINQKGIMESSDNFKIETRESSSSSGEKGISIKFTIEQIFLDNQEAPVFISFNNN